MVKDDNDKWEEASMTDKVKLYVVRNDDGEYLMDPAFEAWFPDWTDDIITADLYEHKEEAEETANKCDSHVVPLVEAPPKVVVSEEEADILKRVANESYPASFIMGAVASNDALYADKESEDRLMRAYVNGYTVAKENNYYVKVPHTKEAWYYKSGDTDLLTICPADKKLRGKFTESEIEQYGLQDCEKVWCDSDD